MATITFQNDTVFQQRRLAPFGCAPVASRLSDPVAEKERQRAQAAAVHFGRREQAPARKSFGY